MSEPALIGRLQDGRELPIHACDCRHCKNEWFIAALSEEWMPNYCPYCGIKFVGLKTDDEPAEYRNCDVISETVAERDEAQNAADRMASLILGEPVDWAFHNEAWKRAIDHIAQ